MDENNNREMDEEDVIHIYDEILLSHKNKIMPLIATWMNLETVILNVVELEKGKYCMILLICVI